MKTSTTAKSSLTRVLVCLWAVMATGILPVLAVEGSRTEKSSIVAGGDHNYPPYEYLDPEGKPAGYNVDLIRAVAEAMGFGVELRLGPWAKVREDLEAGRIDMLQGMYYSGARARHFEFSVPHTMVYHAIFVRKPGGDIHSLEDLEGKAILIQRGDIMHDYVFEKRISDKVTAVDAPEDALRLLASGAHDCALLAKAQGLYLVNKFGLTNLKTTGNPFSPREYCFAARKGNEKLVARLNEGLAIIKATGRYKEIYDKWLGVLEPPGISRGVIEKYAALTLAVFLFLLACALFWFWSLRMQVALRTRELDAEIAERKRTGDALRESEKQYRAIFENAMEGIFQTSPDGRLLGANPSFARIYGYDSPGEMMAAIRDMRQLYVDPGVRDGFMERIEADDSVEAFEIEEYRKDGSTVWVSLTARVVRDEKGKVYCYEGTVEDVTERKKAEESLRLAHQRLSDIIEFLPDATFVIDHEKKVVAWNRACEEMTGVKKEEIIGAGDYSYAVPFYGERRPLLIDLVTADLEDVSKNYRSVARRGNVLYAEAFTPEVYGGKGAFISGNASPLLDREGNVVGAIESIRDITEFKHLEAQLRQSQKMEAIGTLAGGVAHDFNNILTTIIGYSSLLQMDMDDQDPRTQYLEQILASSQKAANLTRSLLAFSRKQVMELKPYGVNGLLAGTERLLKRLLTEDIELRIVPADPDVTIMADTVQMDQILMNLATNARDAMPKGGLLTIEARGVTMSEEFVKAHGYDQPGEYVLVSVTDTGFGMDEATKEKMLEPFFTTKEVGRGTGLGLSIVYGIVKQHSGYIDVYSEPGRGTVFHIYFPAVKAREDSLPQPEVEIPGGRETVLLAEDNDGLRGLTKEVLTRKGYTVVEAVDGEEAVLRFMEHKDSIDLLILDVVMPGKNGKEVYEEIRAVKPDVRALFTSGYTGDVVIDKGIHDEAVDFVPKPLTPDALLLKVREVLDK